MVLDMNAVKAQGRSVKQIPSSCGAGDGDCDPRCNYMAINLEDREEPCRLLNSRAALTEYVEHQNQKNGTNVKPTTDEEIMPLVCYVAADANGGPGREVTYLEVMQAMIAIQGQRAMQFMHVKDLEIKLTKQEESGQPRTPCQGWPAEYTSGDSRAPCCGGRAALCFQI